MTLVDPKPVVLEIARPAKSPSSDEDEIIIINQGYPTEQDEITINDEVYNVSGMMRVTKDGSVYAGNSTDDPRDLSCKCWFVYSVRTYTATTYVATAC